MDLRFFPLPMTKEVKNSMMQLQRRGCSTTATNQMNIVFPAEAFTEEATNFWFGVVFGVGICAACAAMRR